MKAMRVSERASERRYRLLIWSLCAAAAALPSSSDWAGADPTDDDSGGTIATYPFCTVKPLPSLLRCNSQRQIRFELLPDPEMRLQTDHTACIIPVTVYFFTKKSSVSYKALLTERNRVLNISDRHFAVPICHPPSFQALLSIPIFRTHWSALLS